MDREVTSVPSPINNYYATSLNLVSKISVTGTKLGVKVGNERYTGTRTIKWGDTKPSYFTPIPIMSWMEVSPTLPTELGV